MTKPKLLIITDNFLPRWDGIARFLVEVLPKLSESYDISVLAPDFPGASASFPFVTIVRFGISPVDINGFPVAYPSYKKMAAYIKEADIVWVQTIAPLCASGIYLAKKFRKPLIAYVHSIDWVLVERSLPLPNIFRSVIGRITKKLAVWFYGQCDILMVPTQEVADIFEKEGIGAAKILVPLGVNCDKFKPADSKDEAKKSIGVFPEDIVIGYCGRVTRDKDVITLFRAFEWLNKKHKGLKLLIVGPGIPEYIKLFESKENVIVTGAKDDVLPYYQAMDVYVLPSLTETTSLSTLEAMSCGCCVVSTKVGILPQIIINNENGLFFPKKNDLILKKKLQWLLQHKDQMSIFGNRARISIVKHFSWEHTIQSIEKVLANF